MRTIIIFIASLIGIILICNRCTDMDETYREYVIPSGKHYPGKAKSPVAYSGKERVKLVWAKGADPKVNKARVFWNNYTDSIETAITPTQDSVFLLIDPLPEGNYSFVIKTYDTDNYVSVPVEINGISYGESFQSYLLNRAIESDIIDAKTAILSINWGNPDLINGMLGAEVKYKNTAGGITNLFVPSDEEYTEISDFDISSRSYSFRSFFLPDSLCIDTFVIDPFEQRTPPIKAKIDRSNWIATTDSYEPSAQLPVGGGPEFTIDGKTGTYWHTEHAKAMPGYPHWLAYDMKKEIDVLEVELTSRSNFFTADFTKFIIQGSQDGVNWSDYGEFTHPDTKDPQSYMPNRQMKVRYLRIYMTAGPNPYSHLDELVVYGAVDSVEP